MEQRTPEEQRLGLLSSGGRAAALARCRCCSFPQEGTDPAAQRASQQRFKQKEFSCDDQERYAANLSACASAPAGWAADELKERQHERWYAHTGSPFYQEGNASYQLAR